uniref:hypothetical protein n=1 Tax=Siminovitchia fortis TaxID=254758 RepID=UPI001C92CFF2
MRGGKRVNRGFVNEICLFWIKIRRGIMGSKRRIFREIKNIVIMVGVWLLAVKYVFDDMGEGFSVVQ